MNQMNRAFLAAASANPAEIAHAACGSGNLPEYNPARGPAIGFGFGGGIPQIALEPGAVAAMQPQFQLGAPQAAPAAPAPSPQPVFQPRAPVYHYVPAQPGDYTANLLSNSQKLWLHRRALWFGQMLKQIHGPVASPLSDIPDFAETAAAFAATALVGDDYDPITKNATAGWSQQQFTAANDYVVNNFASWWTDAYGAG